MPKKYKILGPIQETSSSYITEIEYNGTPAILKEFKDKSGEHMSAEILQVWNGNSAVKVLVSGESSVILEKLERPNALVGMFLKGADDKATEIIADTICKLHKHSKPLKGVITLQDRYESLFKNSKQSDLHKKAAEIAQDLLSTPTNQTLLHGDIHHENIMYSNRGWVAIDPKGILGESTYDAANTICNPYPHTDLVCNSKLLEHRLNII